MTEKTNRTENPLKILLKAKNGHQVNFNRLGREVENCIHFDMSQAK